MAEQTNTVHQEQKYCKHCGQLIDKDCIICPKCGKQVEQMSQPNVVINNTNQNQNVNINGKGRAKKECNKWVAFFLCLLLGGIGAHKFYEGRIGMGIIYLLTVGLFGIGWLIDTIVILCKPNPYYV